MEGGSVSRQLAELEEFVTRELGQGQRDLNEVRILIRQTTGEVERLTQRNSQSSFRQHEAESNLENLSRQELRDVFAAASENQLRLFMMQSELEQLRSRERTLTKYNEALQRVVDEAAAARVKAGGPTALAPETAIDPSPLAGTVSRIIQAQEAERYRIARQIHDGPAQALTNIVLRAEICARLLDVDPSRARAELAELKDLVTSTLRETRRFIFDVRPMILDDLGLFATVRKYIDTFEEKSKSEVDFVVMGQERRFEPHIEVTVFRIVQEALNNLALHVNGNRAKVTLKVENERIDVVVNDGEAGPGIEEPLARTRDSRDVSSITERVEMLGGRFTFESTPGQGARLMATIPLRS